jgi:transaldolase
MMMNMAMKDKKEEKMTTMKEKKEKKKATMERERRATSAQPAPTTSTTRALRLFLDSASVDDWRRWFPLGTLYGFTTNPLILQRDGVACTFEALAELVGEARLLGARELQLQAWGSADDPAVLLACARRLAALDPRLVTVKLPCTPAGLEAARALMAEGVPLAAGCDDSSSDSSDSSDSSGDEGCARRVPARVTITAVYTAHQALLAQALGADYAAPYVGRMADAAGSASEAEAEVAAMARAARLPGPTTRGPAAGAGGAGRMMKQQEEQGTEDRQMRVLVASLRDAATMARLAAGGCDTFTFSPAVMEELTLGVEATTAAALAFESAAREGGGYAGMEEGGGAAAAAMGA